MRNLYIALLAIYALSCTRNEEKDFLVTRIRSAAKLATQEVVLNKIVIGKDIRGKKFIDFLGSTSETVIFDTEATVKYGIRLDRITNEDVFLDNDSIHILLPRVEIISFSYPHEKYVELFPLSNFNAISKKEETFEDIDEAFRLAETEIREKVELLYLREEAKLKTITVLEKFLSKAGYNRVVFEFEKD